MVTVKVWSPAGAFLPAEAKKYSLRAKQPLKSKVDRTLISLKVGGSDYLIGRFASEVDSVKVNLKKYNDGKIKYKKVTVDRNQLKIFLSRWLNRLNLVVLPPHGRFMFIQPSGADSLGYWLVFLPGAYGILRIDNLYQRKGWRGCSSYIYLYETKQALDTNLRIKYFADGRIGFWVSEEFLVVEKNGRLMGYYFVERVADQAIMADTVLNNLKFFITKIKTTRWLLKADDEMVDYGIKLDTIAEKKAADFFGPDGELFLSINTMRFVDKTGRITEYPLNKVIP